MKVNSFEELDIYKRSRQLTKDIYGLSKTSKFSKDYGLKRPDTKIRSIGHG